MDDRTKALNIASVDWALGDLFKMIERLCREAHMSDEDITEILDARNSEKLEIISDTADEVLVKAQGLIIDARLAVRSLSGRKA